MRKNMRKMDFDYCKIKAFEAGSGKITCEEKLKGYHFGASKSTETDWGVDMRAEVFILDRNIKIQPNANEHTTSLSETWGCRIMVADFFKPTTTQR